MHLTWGIDINEIHNINLQNMFILYISILIKIRVYTHVLEFACQLLSKVKTNMAFNLQDYHKCRLMYFIRGYDNKYLSYFFPKSHSWRAMILEKVHWPSTLMFYNVSRNTRTHVDSFLWCVCVCLHLWVRNSSMVVYMPEGSRW